MLRDQGCRLLASFVPGPRSSGDRAPPSGGGGAGSNPAGGTRETAGQGPSRVEFHSNKPRACKAVGMWWERLRVNVPYIEVNRRAQKEPPTRMLPGALATCRWADRGPETAADMRRSATCQRLSDPSVVARAHARSCCCLEALPLAWEPVPKTGAA